MAALFTRKDYEATPEGFPGELCAGALVRRPSAPMGHHAVRMRVLDALIASQGLDHVGLGPLDVLVDDHNVFVADLLVLDERPENDAQYVGIPRVMFEVLAPDTRHQPYKTRRLLDLGVNEVWLVDRRRSTIEIIDRDGHRIHAGSLPARSRVIEDFELVPAELFGS